MMDAPSFFLHIAAGDLAAVKHQLDASPFLIHVRNPDEKSWDELCFLHSAAKHGHLDMAKLLVERDAEVYSNPQSTYPPIIIAAWNKRQALVDYFLQEIPERANGTNKLGVTINLAARQGWADIVQKHLDADPLSVHQRGWIGDTPLHWPAHNGNVEIVEMLLEAGADIEADEINCYGGKALHWASEHEPKTVALLLKKGADVNARNTMPDPKRCGFTPLIMNASQTDDCAEVTEILLAAGADINATDVQGKTALAHALERDLERIPEVLRKYGANE